MRCGDSLAPESSAISPDEDVAAIAHPATGCRLAFRRDSLLTVKWDKSSVCLEQLVYFKLMNFVLGTVVVLFNFMLVPGYLKTLWILYF